MLNKPHKDVIGLFTCTVHWCHASFLVADHKISVVTCAYY